MSLFKRPKVCSFSDACSFSRTVDSIIMSYYRRWSATFVGANKSQWRERDKPAKAAFLIPYHRSCLIGNSRARWQSRLCSSIL